jgi:potassium large conductance calcium-activated channel subfamily M alpha protein 1
LHSKEPTEKQWTQIAFFPEIYYVKGTAMNKHDLFRANIVKATKVVILAPNVEEVTRKHHQGVDHKMDQNNEESEGDKNSQKLTRDEEDLLDARTIFKYKTVKKIRPEIPIVTELVCPQNLVFLLPHPKDYAVMRKYGYAQTPTFASGEIYFSSVIDSLICQAYYNSALITVLHQLLVGNINYSSKKKDEFSDIKTSNLYHLPVSKAFIVEIMGI